MAFRQGEWKISLLVKRLGRGRASPPARPPLRGIGFKGRNFGGFFLGEKIPKNILGLRLPRLPHNFNLDAKTWVFMRLCDGIQSSFGLFKGFRRHLVHFS